MPGERVGGKPKAPGAGRLARGCTLAPVLSRPALAQALAATVFAEVDRVFGAAQIAVLPVKGVVTGRTLYADPAEREIRDVDVRIRPRDFERALELAGSARWPVRNVLRSYRSFIASVGGLDVDVETSCGPPGFCGLRVDDMLGRAEEGPTVDLPRVPELHDHALLLVVNAVKDHLVDTTPAALEDLRRLVRLPRFSASRLCDLARQTRTLFMVHLAARFLGDEAPGWKAIDVDLSRAHRRRAQAVGVFLRLVRSRGQSSLVVRLATRLTPDGWQRPLEGLCRAARYELETASGRSSSQSRQRSTPGSTS